MASARGFCPRASGSASTTRIPSSDNGMPGKPCPWPSAKGITLSLLGIRVVLALPHYADPEQRQWYAGETVSVAVGQGYNSFTLLQLAQATSVLANDGVYMTPHLVTSLIDPETNEVESLVHEPTHTIDLKPEHLEVIQHAMVDVTQSGTARAAFRDTPYQAAGKTGTAQVFSLRGAKYKAADVDERLRDHA